ncbi:MAG: hypothetical protein M5U09_00305 [Gammaproteobacteria bacterium]|nr:hypothetical protein [Gammaproteobacteria bacterium]
MDSSALLIPLVLLAALLHAGWNAFVRASGDRLVVLAGVNIVAMLVGAALVPFVPLPAPAAWPYILLSVVLHCGYYFYLLKAYDRGELIQVYPLARGSAPLLISIGGVLFAGELLSPWPPRACCWPRWASSACPSSAVLRGARATAPWLPR